MAKNYYIILGLKKDASDEEIRSAYRRLVKNYHPDHYGADNGPFLLIQEAYEVLSDPERKRRYDDILRTRHKPAEMFRDVTAESSPRKHVEPLAPETGNRPIARSFDSFLPSFNEVFDYLWSNYSRLDKPVSGEDLPLTVEIFLSPAEARIGGQVRVSIPVNVRCPSCSGNGGIVSWECWRCAGEGGIRGELPLIIDYPEDLDDGHTIMIPVSRLGTGGTYVTVVFRIN